MFLKLLAIIMLAAFLYKITPGLLKKYHSFLAPNNPADAKVLVVEGWLFGYMLESAKSTFEKGRYRYLIVAGKCLTSSEDEKKKTRCTGESTKKRLEKLGLDPNLIYSASRPNVKKYHTYHSAISVKKWLKENAPEIKAINVFTAGTHGRKTHRIYKNVFEDDIEVGIFSRRVEHYNPDKWWASTRGRKSVFRYTVGYLWALLNIKPEIDFS